MPGLDDRLREGLQELASPVSAAPRTFDRVMSRRRAQRRIHRLQAIALIATVVVGTGAAGAVLVWAFRIERTQPRPASMTPLTGGMVFSNGQLLRFTREGTQVFATLPEKTAPVPPVLTSSGVLVLTGGPSIGLRLWLVSVDGSVEEIADDVTGGFAFDPLADLVAYATARMEQAPPRYRSTVHLVDLRDRKEKATSPELDNSAEVRGIADGMVVLSTGDGASASVRVWIPASQEIRRYSMYGRAQATDPQSGISVLNRGDGQLPIFVRFETAPSGSEGSMIPGEIVVDPSVLQLDGADFQPDGALVAGLQPTLDGVELVVVEETSGEVAFRTLLPGGVQTAWSGHDAVLVLDKEGESGSIRNCDRSVDDCAIVADDLPSGGRFGYGLWLVVGSFEATESSPRPTADDTTRACSQYHWPDSGVFGLWSIKPSGGRLGGPALVAPSRCLGLPFMHTQGPPSEFAIAINWLGATGGVFSLPECDGHQCAAVAAIDFDGNGTDELVIRFDRGASVDTWRIYDAHKPNSKPTPILIAAPGMKDLPAYEPISLTSGGVALFGEAITCQPPHSDGRRLIETTWTANESTESWFIQETIFALVGGAFEIRSTKHRAEAIDQVSMERPILRGGACWPGSDLT